MHILATFATLCCQTRWPRNHSCTTQEHVSFFRDIFGTFSEISTFSRFSTLFAKNWEFSENLLQKHKFHMCMRHWTKKNFTNAQNSHKKISSNVRNCAKHCAEHVNVTILQNVQKCVVHKMRKSAAQIFFQMQKSQICTVHKNTNANFCRVHNFVCAQFRWVTISVLCVRKYFFV